MTGNEPCLAHLRDGGWVLTCNQRQARILRRLHDRERLAAGAASWPAAQVLPLPAWLTGLWQEAAVDRPELPELLPDSALAWLWRSQVEGDAGGLLDPADLGRGARASWLALREQGGDLGLLRRWPLTVDQQAFLRWSAGVERELAARGVIDGADLARQLVDHAALPAAGPPLLLCGFPAETPALAALGTALRARGWRVQWHQPVAGPVPPELHAAADPLAEEQALAAWLRSRLLADPGGIHAAIVPHLAARREALERTLSAWLQPDLELPGGGGQERIFDLAGGAALRGQPVVAAALDALSCLPPAFGWDRASRVLRLPWLGRSAEEPARIRAELALRGDDPRLEWGAHGLAAHCLRHGAPQLAQALAAGAQEAGGERRRSAAGWAASFGRVLQAWGWPGDRPLGTVEYQAAAALRDALRDLAALDRVAGPLDLHQALAALGRALAAPFQAERGEPAVYLLDALEPPGLWFDSLWVAGLTAAAWPRPVAVDPWLPIEAQRLLGMPGATAERRLAEAHRVLRAWQQSCAALVLSWPGHDNDTEIDASVLLPEGTTLALPEPPQRRSALLFAAGRLEPAGADLAPACPPGPARGGARILELQASCPFRAFAELRLAAEPLEEPGPGPDPRRRGAALHRALELFWLATQSRAGLLALAPAERAGRVAAVVAEALREQLPAGAGAQARRLEAEWQQRAIDQLLDRERSRPDFTVVEAERRLDCTFGGLELRLVVDRVDCIGSDLLVIDYKTGALAPAQWRGARPRAPQLPLYAILHPRRPAGIAAARLSHQAAGFCGVAGRADLVDGVMRAEEFVLTEAGERGFDWQQVTRHWWAWLERLAREHAAGQAEVDPLQGGSTCRGCHLALLCRVSGAASDDEEDSSDDAG